MIDYGLGYRNLCQSSTQQELLFIQKNIKSYELLEKLLGFTFSLNAALLPAYEEISNDIENPKHLHISDELMTEGSIAAICALNLHSIWHAIRPLEQNSIHNCANMIRPVYESISKMFYALRYPEDIWQISLREEFGLWLTQRQFYDEINQIGIAKGFMQNNPRATPSDYEYLYLKCYLAHNYEGKTLQKKLNMNVSKTSYKKFKGKYNNDWFRTKIYTGESLQMQNTTYASLSMSSHANFTRSRTTIAYDPIRSPRFFKILTDLAFFNLYIFFNASHQTISKIGESEDTKNFIVNARQELESYYAMTHLYPDVQEYIENLILYPEKPD